jgi:hypothetical protein
MVLLLTASDSPESKKKASRIHCGVRNAPEPCITPGNPFGTNKVPAQPNQISPDFRKNSGHIQKSYGYK